MPARLFGRYRELQLYVGWKEEDATMVRAVAQLIDPFLPALIDDFYEQIERFAKARSVITGGQMQIDRLKGTLLRWVRDLFNGVYDASYVERRWRVGFRHVEIGLAQVYTNVALSRLRSGLCVALEKSWAGDLDTLRETTRALNTLLDLDLAIIEDAYQEQFSLKLQRTERLATLGQVAGGIAHELRNPLNVVKTSVYYLLNARNLTSEKSAEHLRRIERQVEIADGVITTLSSFAKMSAPLLRPIAVEPSVREALETSPMDGGIRVEVDLPPSLPAVLADADQLRIVFGNLIRNARDAMAQGGTLTINGSHTGDNLEVTVADTGVGIPKEDLLRISEPLYSTKARGLGLGLAIVRAVLDKCGGELRVESDHGRGSTFTVRLMTAPNRQDGESG